VEEIESGMTTAAFKLNDDNFEKRYGFKKPEAESQTIIFTCRSGARSGRACMHASEEGYKCINYTGGANDWFK
jgi:rhodanese-related sulfurtransferase